MLALKGVPGPQRWRLGGLLDDLERLARRFLQDNAALFRDGLPVLELDRAASFRLRYGLWQLAFRQRVDGVRMGEA